ncbi:MAG: alkaline phosphatase family protein [Kofleriaceae bacterium]|jgi:hypothetical protein|nr:alkaline phosphatase family protein [Kofleriaceae bacterium]
MTEQGDPGAGQGGGAGDARRRRARWRAWLSRTPARGAAAWAVIAAIVLVVVGAVAALRAALAGADFMYDLEQPRSALARTEPALVEPGTPRLARHVFLVIVDGLRHDASRPLPYLASLRQRGVDAVARSHYPSWSRPNYVSILTGVPPQASGVRTNRHFTPVMLDALMDRTRAAGLRTAVASDNSPLPALFLRPVDVEQLERINIDTMTEPDEADRADVPDIELRTSFDDSRYAPWPGGVIDAVLAQRASGPDLQVVLVGVVDDNGHAHGAASEEYAAATRMADRTLARALAGVDLGQDAVVVVADHGHTDRGGHGGVEPEVMQVPLVLAGAGVRVGATIDGARLIDVAPTVAALLGVPAPGHGLGRTLTELLVLTPQAAQARADADGRRLAVTQRVVARSRQSSLAEAVARRGWRLLAVGGLVVLLLGTGLVLRRVGGVRFSWRALALGVPAFFIVYYALIAALGQRFSPSLLPARGHLAAELAKVGLVGVAAHVAVGWWALRREVRLSDRLAVANGNAVVGLVFTLVPASLLWALFPAPYTEVPGPTLLVLIPAMQVAVALYAGAILLALLIEVVVFLARAVDPDARLRRLERAAERVRAARAARAG